MEIGTEYDTAGEWMDVQVISSENDSKHAAYYTYYVDDYNRLWKVDLMANIFSASIISAEDEEADISNLLITEADYIMSYDNASKTFFEFEPNDDIYSLEKNYEITAESLNNYSWGD